MSLENLIQAWSYLGYRETARAVMHRSWPRLALAVAASLVLGSMIL